MSHIVRLADWMLDNTGFLVLGLLVAALMALFAWDQATCLESRPTGDFTCVGVPTGAGGPVISSCQPVRQCVKRR